MRFLRLTVMFVVAIQFVFSCYIDAEEIRFSPRPNRAHLINWRHWGEDVFKEAKSKDRLILLSLSAIWCYWCHVMDETTYSDPRVIELINREFIPIRVDSDMRPDIDALYNQGGWPSTVLLTPDGEVLTGGTYIPPERMISMLKNTLKFYRKNRYSIKKRLKELSNTEGEVKKENRTEDDFVIIEKIVRFLREEFDERYGGFDIGQKFPRPEVLDFLLVYYANKTDNHVKRMIVQTLDAMEMTRLYDHIEGGFFRYSVKRDWSRPHFEKMLDVNAGLLKTYIGAYSLLGKKSYLDTAQGVYRYLITHLYDSNKGLFFGSQDADEFYYNARDRKLLKPPEVDKTFYADRNALMLSALVRYAGLGSSKEADRVVRKLADALIRHFYKKDVGVYHYIAEDDSPRLTGLLKDNVTFGVSMIDLYEYTGNRRYLSIARSIGRLLKRWVKENGLLKYNMNRQVVNPVTASMLKRYLEIRENYRALYFLARLAFYDRMFYQFALSLKEKLLRGYERFNFSTAILAKALTVLSVKVFEFKIVSEEKNLKRFLDAINEVFVPVKKVQVYIIGRDNKKLLKDGLSLKDALYICKGTRCFSPIGLKSNLRKKIKDITGR